MYATTNNIILALAEFYVRSKRFDSSLPPNTIKEVIDHISKDPEAWALDELEWHLANSSLSMKSLLRLSREADPVVRVYVLDPIWLQSWQLSDYVSVPCSIVPPSFTPDERDAWAAGEDYFRCCLQLTTDRDTKRKLKFLPPQGHPTILSQVMNFSPKGSRVFCDALSVERGVGMAFELAGFTCPRNIDKWKLVPREFGVTNGVPYQASGVRGAPHLGSVTCIATDHELALVIGGSQQSMVRMVHCEAIIDPLMDQIREFVARNSGGAKKASGPRKARETTTPTDIDATQYL